MSIRAFLVLLPRGGRKPAGGYVQAALALGYTATLFDEWVKPERMV